MRFSLGYGIEFHSEYGLSERRDVEGEPEALVRWASLLLAEAIVESTKKAVENERPKKGRK